MVINKRHITKVYKYSDGFHIYMSDDKYFSGFIFFSSGFISTSTNYLNVCKEKDKEDYATIEKWMNEL